jgi:hypothetical protein
LLRELPPPPPEDGARARDDAEDERRLEALDLLPLALFAFVAERGLLFDAVERPLLERPL